MTVSTPLLAKRYARFNDTIRVIRNAVIPEMYVQNTDRPPGDLPRDRDEVLHVVVDGAGRAQALARGALVPRAGGRDHAGAERAGQLDRGRADPARAAVHQHPFPGLQAAVLEEVRPHREERLGDRGGVDGVEAARDRQALGARHGGVLGVAAAGNERRDAVARRERRAVGPRRLRAGRHDGAGQLETRDVGGSGRRRVLAHPLHHVRPVDAGRRDFDEHLARARNGHGPLGHSENIWASRPGDFDDAHRGHGVVSSVLA